MYKVEKGIKAGKTRMNDTLLRQWEMLRLLPRYPQYVTAQKLTRKLGEEGYKVSKRTIERDLQSLSTLFPITANEEVTPFEWSWHADKVFDLPGMDLQTALTFHLAGTYLEPLFPKNLLNTIRPWFELARNQLEAIGGQTGDWPEKVRMIAKGLPLKPVEVNDDICQAVYEAVFHGYQLQATYQPRGEEPNSYRVHPQGLIVRAGVIYVVAMLRDYDNLMLLALHRFSSAEVTWEPCRRPTDFNLDDYIDSGVMNIPVSDQTIEIELRCHQKAVLHLFETPLSDDQQITPLQDDEVIIQATVKDTMDLRWWIKSQGEQIEVIRPQTLRDEIAAEIQRLAARYSEGSTPETVLV